MFSNSVILHRSLTTQCLLPALQVLDKDPLDLYVAVSLSAIALLMLLIGQYGFSVRVVLLPVWDANDKFNCVFEFLLG